MTRRAEPTIQRSRAAHDERPARRALRLAAALLATALLAHTQVHAQAESAPDVARPEVERAAFYAPYAAMATEVYRSGSSPESWFGPALSTAWLRREIDVHGTALNQKRFWTLELGLDREREAYMEQLKVNCVKELDGAPIPDGLVDLKAAKAKPSFAALLKQLDVPRRVNCYALKWELELQAEQAQAGQEEVNVYQPGEPQAAKDCDWSTRSSAPARARPHLDVQAMVDKAGWALMPELRRVSAVRGWRVFVPELAVDVWQRPRAAPAGHRLYEYAIVFRGTVGGGGWVSNMRGLTAGLPIFWDQYAQALDVTRKLVIQIQGMHVLRDNLLEVSNQYTTQLLFTVVGHSLGGGLAQHVFLNVPAVTRVVAFDPSPLDGSSLIPVDQPEPEVGVGPRADTGRADAAPAAQGSAPKPRPSRSQVMHNGTRPIDTATERHALERTTPGAAIYLLHEHGEFLSNFRSCQSGPLWGSEGGPVIACESVNYSTGGPFSQHSMAELACRLELASRGISARSAR